MNEITTEILIIFFLILANSIFASSEMAIVSSRKTRLQQRADEGDKGAAAALTLSKEPTRFQSRLRWGTSLMQGNTLPGMVGVSRLWIWMATG